MGDKSQGVLPSLNVAIGALNRAKEATSVTPAKTAFTSASVLLTMIRAVGLLLMFVDCRLMITGLDGQKSELCRTGADLR